MFVLDKSKKSAVEIVSSTCSLLFIEAREAIAEAFKLALGRYRQFTSLSHAPDIARGLSSLRTLQPDLVIVSNELFPSGVHQLLDEVTIRLREVQLAVFVNQLTDRQIQAALDMKLAGYLSYEDPLPALVEHLEQAAGGQMTISKLIQPLLVEDKSSETMKVARRAALSQFSNRQLDIVRQLAEGMTVKEVAKSVNLSEKSVESHKFRIMKRLGLQNRIELCRWAIREGLIAL